LINEILVFNENERFLIVRLKLNMKKYEFESIYYFVFIGEFATIRRIFKLQMIVKVHSVHLVSITGKYHLLFCTIIDMFTRFVQDY
jgi:hypothetical protein